MKIVMMATDITGLVTECTWKGSRQQVARELEFSFVQDDRDPNIPVIKYDNGYTVWAYDDENKLFFRGNIYRVTRNRTESKVSILARDNLFVLTRSKTTRKFVNVTPEVITKGICAELGVWPGNIMETNTPVTFIAREKTGYEIIMGAYTEASKKNGKKYHLMMDDDKLDVIEKGTLIDGFVADAAVNMTESEYVESIEKLINQILITDEEGNSSTYIKDDESIKKYSMFQAVYKTDPNKDTQTESKNLMTAPERSGHVTVLGDYRVKSAYSIQIRDTNFNGKFWVKSDVHTFTDGMHEMKLELEFENIMNEVKTEQEKEKKEKIQSEKKQKKKRKRKKKDDNQEVK